MEKKDQKSYIKKRKDRNGKKEENGKRKKTRQKRKSEKKRLEAEVVKRNTIEKYEENRKEKGKKI